MEHCEHAQSVKERVTKSYFGEDFVVSTDVCTSCGANLSEHRTQQKFNHWLMNLRSNKPDRFTVQFAITNPAEKCFSELVKKFHGVDESTLFRALVLVYLNSVVANPEIQKMVEGVTNREVFHTISVGERSNRKKVRFQPIGLLDLYSWSEILDMPVSRLMEESILRILALCIENDPVLKDFWTKTILPAVQLILKAA